MLTINEIIDGDSEDTAFLESLAENHQSRLLEAIRTLRNNISEMMNQLTTTDGGRLEGVKVNLKQAQNVHKKLVGQFEKDYNTKVNRLIGDFSAIESTIKRRYKYLDESIEFANIDDKMLNALKENTYTRYIAFGEDARNQIAEAMYKAVAGGAKFSFLLNTITGILTGHEDIKGRPMTMYAQGFAHDAIMNYHNQVNIAKGEEIGLNDFLYYGDLIATSRPFCITRVGKVYTKRQILAWDSLSWKGKSSSAWTDRGGYNCRHHWRPVKREWIVDEDGEVVPQNEMIAYMHADSDPRIKELTQKIEEKRLLYKASNAKTEDLKIRYYAMKGQRGKEFAAERKKIYEEYQAGVAERKAIKAEIEKLRSELGSLGGKIKKNAKKQVAAKVKVITPKAKIAQTVAKVKSLEDQLFDVGIHGVQKLEGENSFSNKALQAILDETERISSYSPIVRQVLSQTMPIENLQIARNKTLEVIGHGNAKGVHYHWSNKIAVGGDDDLALAESSLNFKSGKSWSASEITGKPITTYRHEVGHHIQDALEKEKYWIEKDLNGKWYEIYENMDGPDYFSRYVTKYSATNENEAFADSFAIFTSKNYKKGWLPKPIEDFFDELFSVPSASEFSTYVSKETQQVVVRKAAEKVKPDLMAIAYDVSSDCILDNYKPNACKDYVRRNGVWFMQGKKVGTGVAKKLESMRIPPAWQEVVVSANPKTEIQAIGLDAAGRWQYRYSQAHIDAAKRKKFVRLKNFRKDISSIEQRIANGMREGDARAYLLQLENKTAIRIGTDRDFKAKKKAYGLTTLESRHVQIDGSNITLKFTAKEGIPAEYKIQDPKLAKWLTGRKKEIGLNEKLFPDVPANTLNGYLKEISGKSYTVKDFRTYHGTRIAFEELKKYAGKTLTNKEKKEVIKGVCEKVSQFLKNTPTMAKNSYIDPMVWDFVGGL